MEIRRLGPGDEAIVRRLATREPRTALLSDERTIFVAALDGGEPVGFVFGYELERRHGDPSLLFVYELDVDEAQRRQGVATRLWRELERIARGRGIREAFVLTNASNEAAMRLYASVGGFQPDDDVVMWDFAWSEDG